MKLEFYGNHIAQLRVGVDLIIETGYYRPTSSSDINSDIRIEIGLDLKSSLGGGSGGGGVGV